MTLLELRALAGAPSVPASTLALAFDMRKHGRNWDDIVKAVHAVHPGVRRHDLVSALVAAYPETNRPPPAKLRAKLDAVARRYAQLAATGNDWGSIGSAVDCKYASLSVGEVVECMGHRVRVVVGDAVGSDNPGAETLDPDGHYWLEVDGYAYDPKERILQDEDASFTYLRKLKTEVLPLGDFDNEDDPEVIIASVLIQAYLGSGRRS